MLLAVLLTTSTAVFAQDEEQGWSQVVSRVANSVVSLQLSKLRSFDDAPQGNSNATGFVVDAERGIILTNRHVVGSGPIRVSATFQNQERIDVVPLYRDPIHDFAFLKYEPSDVQYARPLTLALRPDKARTGLNIRVIGSDGGEQLSILPGTIARLDREVPSYGRYGYNDFNTFYMQAASGTSGGSSGSPVIDSDGDVVALNAAANTRTASSFFLPLPRIVYALERLQQQQPIDRGSFQTLFSHQPYRQLQRLGLDAETENTVRQAEPDGNGMLVVSQVIPGGVADQLLEPGDILVRLQDRLITDFISLAEILDASVSKASGVETPDVSTPGVSTPGVSTPGVDTPGVSTPGVSTPGVSTPDVSTPGVDTSNVQTTDMNTPSAGTTGVRTLSAQVIRQGRSLELELPVADLHALAPSQLLELGDTVLQDMSIQHARAMNLPQSGVVVMQPGYMLTRAGIPRGAVITELEGQPVDTLGSLTDQLQATSDIARKRVRFVVPRREFTSELGQFQVDNRWFTHRLCTRVDAVRFWDCQAVDIPSATVHADSGESIIPGFRDPLLSDVAPSMVKVDFSIPYPVDNVYARHFNGVGLIVDAEQGLIAVDRNTVPVALGDVQLTFFGALQLPGEVVFLHPRHNLALVRYDPQALADEPVQALSLNAEDQGWPDDLWMVGYRRDGTFRKHAVDDLSPVTVDFNAPSLPRFQQSAIDLYNLSDAPPSLGGPLVDDQGTVYAVYMSFAFEDNREILQQEYAMPASVIAAALELYRSGQPYYSLDARLAYRPLYVARELGLPDEWLRKFNALPADDRHVLYIEQLVPDTHAGEVLASGDILLAIDGQPVSDLFLAERLSQQSALSVALLRNGDVIELELRPSAIDSLGVQRFASWAGAYFQAPFPDIGYQKGVHFPGVYIANTEEGSPALWDALYRNRFVVAVDGQSTETLDEFLLAVSQLEQDAITRLTVISMSGRKSIVTVQPEYNFWPTFEIRRESEGWMRVDYSAEDG